MIARALLPVVLAATVAGAGDPAGSPEAREALDICRAGQKAPAAERAATYARGLALAERAIAADPRDAKAHFAAFCNRGRQMELAGHSIKNAFALHRLRADIDHAVELAPDWSDALGGKGRLLLDTPAAFGGDAAEGERLLRRSIELDPHDAGVRLRLAHALADRGAKAEARTEAERAAADASGEEAAEARALADSLR